MHHDSKQTEASVVIFLPSYYRPTMNLMKPGKDYPLHMVMRTQNP